MAGSRKSVDAMNLRKKTGSSTNEFSDKEELWLKK